MLSRHAASPIIITRTPKLGERLIFGERLAMVGRLHRADCIGYERRFEIFLCHRGRFGLNSIRACRSGFDPLISV